MRHVKGSWAWCALIPCLIVFGIRGRADASLHSLYSQNADWAETLLAARGALASAAVTEAERERVADLRWRRLAEDFPVHCDWVMQDSAPGPLGGYLTAAGGDLERRMISRVLDEVGDEDTALRAEYDGLCAANAPAGDRRWSRLYVRACE